MSAELVQILEGNTFVVSDTCGDIAASLSDPTGLFSFDTRFLSRWTLTVNGETLNPLSVDDDRYYEARFFLVPGTGTVYVDSKLSVIRARTVGDGFYESLTILNHEGEPVDLVVRLDAACDFADLFEVKDALKKKGSYFHRLEKGRLVLGYERSTYKRETWITAPDATTVDEHGIEFSVRIAAHGQWSTDVSVQAALGAGGRAASSPRGPARTAAAGPTWPGASTSGSHGPRPWCAARPRCSGPTSGAWWTWRRCASPPSPCPTTRSRRPACRGS